MCRTRPWSDSFDVGTGRRFAPLVVESFALHQQRDPVELEPLLEHVPLAEDERRFLPARIFEIFDHRLHLPINHYHAGRIPRPARVVPGNANRR